MISPTTLVDDWLAGAQSFHTNARLQSGMGMLGVGCVRTRTELLKSFQWVQYPRPGAVALSQIVRQHEEVDRVTVQREHPPVETTAEQRVIKTTIMQRKSPGSPPRPVTSPPVCCMPSPAALLTPAAPACVPNMVNTVWYSASVRNTHACCLIRRGRRGANRPLQQAQGPRP